MDRAVRLTLKFATSKKKKAIAALLDAYRHAVNFFVESLWHKPGKLDSETLGRLAPGKTRLSYKQRNAALKQAISIIVATKRSAKALRIQASMPIFRGAAIFPKELVIIQDGQKSFDLVVRISSLKKHSRIIIPTRKTKVLNQWLAKPSAEVVKGCALLEDKIIIWVKLPDTPSNKSGRILAVDQGMNNLIVTSDGEFLGDFKALREKISKKKPGGKAKRRAIEERRHFIGEQIKKLPWESLSALGVEELKDIKKGKGNRSKRFRKARIPWVHRMVTVRLGHKAEENRVLVMSVPPENTSRCCPACGKVSAKNRVGEKFLCVSCGHEGHADFIGATNILAKTIQLVGSVASPMPANVIGIT